MRRAAAPPEMQQHSSSSKTTTTTKSTVVLDKRFQLICKKLFEHVCKEYYETLLYKKLKNRYSNGIVRIDSFHVLKGRFPSTDTIQKNIFLPKIIHELKILGHHHIETIEIQQKIEGWIQRWCSNQKYVQRCCIPKDIVFRRFEEKEYPIIVSIANEWVNCIRIALLETKDGRLNEDELIQRTKNETLNEPYFRQYARTIFEEKRSNWKLNLDYREEDKMYILTASETYNAIQMKEKIVSVFETMFAVSLNYKVLHRKIGTIVTEDLRRELVTETSNLEYDAGKEGGTYTYTPDNDIRSAKDILMQLKAKHVLTYKDICDSYPGIENDIDMLWKSGDIILVGKETGHRTDKLVLCERGERCLVPMETEISFQENNRVATIERAGTTQITKQLRRGDAVVVVPDVAEEGGENLFNVDVFAHTDPKEREKYCFRVEYELEHGFEGNMLGRYSQYSTSSERERQLQAGSRGRLKAGLKSFDHISLPLNKKREWFKKEKETTTTTTTGGGETTNAMFSEEQKKSARVKIYKFGATNDVRDLWFRILKQKKFERLKTHEQRAKFLEEQRTTEKRRRKIVDTSQNAPRKRRRSTKISNEHMKDDPSNQDEI